MNNQSGQIRPELPSTEGDSNHMEERKQKRVILFVFDGGTGIGHLRRLACIAKKLQGRFACLIVTGHRAAAHWLVPEECEYIHLPSWDSLLETKAQYWGRKPFILLNEMDALQLRRKFLQGIMEAFAPDVIFVDHLPLGTNGELADIIKDARCLKYLVTRGVLNETENLRELILGGKANTYLRSCYDKIFVAADRKIFDFSKRYNLSPEIRDRTIQVGYVVESVPQQVIQKTRECRGVKNETKWVVASAGGGQFGESLIEKCLELARIHNDIAFDVILGPRTRIPWDNPNGTVVVRDNLYLHKEAPQMAVLHASADLVISSGGYNSLLETLQGNAKILCFPSRKDQRDEPYRHAMCLAKYIGIQVSTALARMPSMFEEAISSLNRYEPLDQRRAIDFNGAAQIERLVLEDIRARQ